MFFFFDFDNENTSSLTNKSVGMQVRNGKAFEFAMAKTYATYLEEQGLQIEFEKNRALQVAQGFYYEFPESIRSKFDNAAYQTIDTMVKIEPKLISQTSMKDVLRIMLNEDSDGQTGDVRDVVFQRFHPSWEIGFSAKNNNDAVKHSRLGRTLDFGKQWVGVPCSQKYWDNIKPIFDFLEIAIQEGKKWDDLGADKSDKVYRPLLKAFADEVLHINANNPEIPSKLIQYLIGNYPFYKVIKDDAHNMVIVKAFNINGELNKNAKNTPARYKTPKINMPTRIIEFAPKASSDTTYNMVLDGGWEISFRIHNASTKVERSLKFDIQLLGNPPILFTQHLFQ